MGTTTGKDKQPKKDASHKGEPTNTSTNTNTSTEAGVVLEPAVTEADMPTTNAGGGENAGADNTDTANAGTENTGGENSHTANAGGGTENAGGENAGGGNAGGENAGTENAGGGDTLKLQGEIDRLKVLLETAHDNVLRARADTENARNRATKDKLDGIMYANKGILVDLLPVVDNLELALAHLKTSADNGNTNGNANGADSAPEESAKGEKGGVASFADGVAITLKQFITTLAKHGVEPIETPMGTPFDPNFHEGLMLEHNPELDDNTVSGTLQTGYTLNGRVVRPAKVKVSKK